MDQNNSDAEPDAITYVIIFIIGLVILIGGFFVIKFIIEDSKNDIPVYNCEGRFDGNTSCPEPESIDKDIEDISREYPDDSY